MLTRNRTLIALILGVVVVALTACALVRQLNGVATAGSPTTLPTAAPASTAATTPTPATSPTPSPTPTISKTEARVVAAVTNYYRVTDELEQKPPRDPYKKLFSVTRGEAFGMWQNTVVQDRFEGRHQTGGTKISSLKVGKAKKSGKSERVSVGSCIDVTDVDILDKKGKSIVPASRANRASETLLVEQQQKTWYVIQVRNGKTAC